MYYVPCSICGRLRYEIILEGCSQCMHGPTPDEQAGAVARHELAQREIMALRAALPEEHPATSEAAQPVEIGELRRTSKFLVPTAGSEDWRRLLAEPDKQWRAGYSAKALATCWEAANGFPASVRSLLDTSEFPELHGLEMLVGLPEHRVPLPGGRRPSQTDLLVLARSKEGLVVIAVEGKVMEPFGPLVRDWLAASHRSDGSNRRPSEGKETRLDFLASKLGLGSDDLAELRYQLVHRTVSALIEGQRFSARCAIMLVHSFSEAAEGLADYERFAVALRSTPLPARDQLTRVQVPGDIALYLGWATGEQAFVV
jgi:hypothetical protein